MSGEGAEPTDLPADELGVVDLRVGAYAIVHDERGVLLAHWREGAYGGWTLPGGGVEPGEHPEQTVVREVQEETGFDVRVDGILGVGSILIPGARRIPGPGRDLQALRIVYRCTIVGGALAVERDGTTDDVRWFALDEVAGLERVELVDEGLAYAGLAVPGPGRDDVTDRAESETTMSETAAEKTAGAASDRVVEVLHIDECPNWQQTVDDVRAALAELGAGGVRVVERLLASPDEAAAVPFAGSPTILVDGADPFSTGQTTTELACRVYRTEEGLRGTPSRRQLVVALAGVVGASRG